MNDNVGIREVSTELGLKVSCARRLGSLTRVLKLLRERGGSLQAHYVHQHEGGRFAFFVCEKPDEAALALQQAGMEVETETVVTVCTERHPAAVSHLVHTLEIEGVSLDFSFATSRSDDLFVVLRTSDNPKAEDVLRKYLILADTADPTLPRRDR